jgi:hypothetical protein
MIQILLLISNFVSHGCVSNFSLALMRADIGMCAIPRSAVTDWSQAVLIPLRFKDPFHPGSPGLFFLSGREMGQEAKRGIVKGSAFGHASCDSKVEEDQPNLK